MRHITALLVVVISLLGCTANEDYTVAINQELNDLQELVVVAEYFYVNPSIEVSIVKKVEGIIFKKVLIVRTLQPSLAQLDGASIKGLCAVVVLSKKPEFGRAVDDGELKGMVSSYLAGIEPQLELRAKELKKTIFTESDCAI